MEVFIGTIMPFPYNFVPYGWLACVGQLLPIQSYSALYALIGTAYGGNGTTNFALPNLNNFGTGTPARVVAGQGQGPGLSDRIVGETDGSDTVTLTTATVPQHNHSLTLFTGGSATRTATPTAGYTVFNPGDNGFLAPGTTPATTLNVAEVVPQGGGQSHNNDQPTLTLYYCIAYDGYYPTFG